MNRSRFLVLVAFASLTVARGAEGATPQAKPPDLTGVWRVDPAQSDAPPSPGRGGGRYDGMGHPGGGGYGEPGGYGGPGGFGGPGGPPPEGGPPPGERGARGGAGRRPPRLPDLMLVAQYDGYVSLEDSTKAEVLRIVFDDSSTKSDEGGGAPPVLAGRWKGDKLEAERDDSRGFRIKQTWSLKEKGRLLEVRTKFEGLRTIEMKRVYVRQSAAK